MKIARTDRFKKAWKQLTQEEKILSRKAITNLATNVRYPSLRVKKIQGTNNIWEARASHSMRVTFQIEGNTIILRNIGRHDEALGHP